MSLKPLFHSSQKPTRKLAARTFIQSQYLKAFAASLRVGFCDEWTRGFRMSELPVRHGHDGAVSLAVQLQ